MTRQGTMTYHIHAALKHSGATLRSYASAVAEHYLQHVPLHLRAVTFHATRDIYADERANAQIISRMLDGTVRMPVEIEESLVLCLPQPFQAELQRELAERLGLLAAPLPSHDGARDLVHAADLMRETAEAMMALAPMLADGVIDAADAPHARLALQEIRDVQARCATLEARLVSCLAQAELQPKTNIAPLRKVAV